MLIDATHDWPDRRWKPLGPVAVNRAHPLVRSMTLCYLFPGIGTQMNLAGYPLPLSLATSRPVAAGSVQGLVVDVSGANVGLVSSSTVPAIFKPSTDVTIMTWFTRTGTPSNDSAIAGMFNNATDSAPYTSYVIGFDGSASQFRFNKNVSGSYASVSWTGGLSAVGTLTCLAATLSGGATTYLYRNGVLEVTDPGSVTIFYGSDATFAVGFDPGTSGRSAAVKVHAAMVWNRSLSGAEMAQMYRDPFGILVPVKRQPRAKAPAVTARPPAFRANQPQHTRRTA
jgi:hypothetical protein